MNKKNIYSIIFLILTLTFSFLLLWGVFSKTIVNEDIFIYHWTKILTFIITIYLLNLSFKSDSWLQKGFNVQKNNSKIKKVISIIIGVPILSTIFLEMSVPAALHYFFSKPSEKIVIIEKKLQGHRLYCHNGVILKGHDSLNGRVCGLDDTTINKISSGDKLVLSGNTSIFGFTYNKYRYISR